MNIYDWYKLLTHYWILLIDVLDLWSRQKDLLTKYFHKFATKLCYFDDLQKYFDTITQGIVNYCYYYVSSVLTNIYSS